MSDAENEGLLAATHMSESGREKIQPESWKSRAKGAQLAKASFPPVTPWSMLSLMSED